MLKNINLLSPLLVITTFIKFQWTSLFMFIESMGINCTLRIIVRICSLSSQFYTNHSEIYCTRAWLLGEAWKERSGNSDRNSLHRRPPTIRLYKNADRLMATRSTGKPQINWLGLLLKCITLRVNIAFLKKWPPIMYWIIKSLDFECNLAS